MSITLQDFASGDTNYVSKFNSNNDVLESAIGSLQTATSAGGSATVSVPTAYAALFGNSVALIGAASYACTDAGSGNLSVAAGFCYRPSLIAVVSKGTSTTLAFTGLTAATYYIVVGSTGTPERSDSSIEAIYSVVWTGTAFGAITRLAAIVWGASDWIAAQSSTALGATYTTLDARLEANEGGALARTFQTGRLSKDVSASGTITLTATEANNVILNLTGTLTATTNVIIPIGTNPRVFVVTNNTTGAFTLTVKGATGTGVAVATGATKVIYQDGTNVIDLIAATSTGAGTVTSVNITAPAAGITASGGPVTSSGSITLALANDLSALEGLSGTGFAKRTGTDTWSAGALGYSDMPTGMIGKPRVDAHTYASSVTLDCSLYDLFEITLTGNITIAFSGGTDGQRIAVRLTQDGTGSRIVTWDSAVTFGTDIASATATTTASKIDYFGLIYNSTASKYHMVAVARGY